MDYTSAYQRAMTGDQEGFRFLYDSTAQPVYEYLLAELGDQPKADQMIGKVYEQAWANLGNLANPEEFPGWVYSIAENMVTQEKGSIPVPPIGGGEAAGASSGNALAGGEAGITPNAAHMSSPNAAHMSSPNAAHSSSPNVANMTDGGMQQMSAGATGGQGVSGSNLASAGNQIPGSNLASVGSNAGKGAQAAATGSQAGAAGAKTAAAAGGSGAKATFLSTALGKVILGVGIAATATALGVGGYFVAKKINHKDEPTTESTEISSAEIETEASTDKAVTTEATTEEATTEEAQINVHQLYVSYMNEVLIPDRGIHQKEQAKTSSGPEPGSDKTGPAWFDGGGIYIADFDDYDGDGEEEMLVVSGIPSPANGVEHYTYTDTLYQLKAEMYNVDQEKVVLQSESFISGIYDGYEGGDFPFVLTKVKKDDAFYLFTESADVGYRTDASTRAQFAVYSTKNEIRPLYILNYRVGFEYAYEAWAFDYRTDPNNTNATQLKTSEDSQKEDGIRDLTKGGDLALPLYKEQIPQYFTDWGISLNDNYRVADGTQLIEMIIDYNQNLYKMNDGSGFHDADWVTAKKEEPTTEEQKVDTGAVLPFEGTLSFTFASGAGAWGTGLELDSSGHFVGGYHDSDMGSSGDGYDATVYVSNFEGQFKNITKIDDYTYKMEMDHYTTEEPAGTSEIQDMNGARVKYEYSEPYGIETGTVFYLYLPGKPVSELDEQFIGWSYGSVGTIKDDVTMKQYGLYNESEGYGFFTTK